MATGTAFAMATPYNTNGGRDSKERAETATFSSPGRCKGGEVSSKAQISTFRDLEVWTLGMELVLETYAAAAKLPGLSSTSFRVNCVDASFQFRPTLPRDLPGAAVRTGITYE
jgi:hypothetical protein